MMMVMALALVLLLGGGAGAYLFFGDQLMGEETTEESGDGKAGEGAGAEGAGADGAGGEGTGDGEEGLEALSHYAYIFMAPVVVPLIRNAQADSFLTFELTLEVTPDAVDLVNYNLPRLRNEFISYIHALADLQIEPGLEDLPFVQKRLKRISEKVLGPGIVHEVLYRHAFLRPI